MMYKKEIDHIERNASDEIRATNKILTEDRQKHSEALAEIQSQKDQIKEINKKHELALANQRLQSEDQIKEINKKHELTLENQGLQSNNQIREIT